jgi:uncharacterized protein (DUF3820 family)
MKMPFGKYKDKNITEIDTSYLNWLLNNTTTLKSTFKIILKVLKIPLLIQMPKQSKRYIINFQRNTTPIWADQMKQ